MEKVTFKVIANYPLSIYCVGAEVSVYAHNCMAYVIDTGMESFKVDLRDYPHLFELV